MSNDVSPEKPCVDGHTVNLLVVKPLQGSDVDMLLSSSLILFANSFTVALGGRGAGLYLFFCLGLAV